MHFSEESLTEYYEYPDLDAGRYERIYAKYAKYPTVCDLNSEAAQGDDGSLNNNNEVPNDDATNNPPNIILTGEDGSRGNVNTPLSVASSKVKIRTEPKANGVMPEIVPGKFVYENTHDDLHLKRQNTKTSMSVVDLNRAIPRPQPPLPLSSRKSLSKSLECLSMLSGSTTNQNMSYQGRLFSTNDNASEYSNASAATAKKSCSKFVKLEVFNERNETKAGNLNVIDEGFQAYRPPIYKFIDKIQMKQSDPADVPGDIEYPIILNHRVVDNADVERALSNVKRVNDVPDDDVFAPPDNAAHKTCITPAVSGYPVIVVRQAASSHTNYGSELDVGRE